MGQVPRSRVPDSPNIAGRKRSFDEQNRLDIIKMKILVVDDNEAIRSGLCELLQRADPTFCCESAGDGNEALEKAKATKPDVVVLDMLMPGMGGLSTARLISHRFPSIKILLHTVDGSDSVAANASRYGVFRVVEKADGQNVLSAIRKIGFDQERGAS